MRRSKRITYVLLAAVLLSGSVCTPIISEAGVQKTVIDTSKLEGGDWSNPEGDVSVSEGTLIFPDDSNEYTRYISKTTTRADKNFDELVAVSCFVKLTKMGKGKSFILAFGLGGIEALPGEAGNVEVLLTNQGSIKAGITAYDEEGNAHVVAKPQASGISLNKAAKLDVSIGTDKKIMVQINGKTVCSGTLPVSGEGRVGFMQTGDCGAEVTEFEMTNYQYARPENPDVFEDFEKGEMDASKLHSKVLDFEMVYPRGQVIEEYKGNQVMFFKNTATAYLGTMYQYSNFEISFDVPFLNPKTEYGDDGKVKVIGQTRFLISFGGEQYEWNDVGFTSAVDAIVYDKSGVYSNNNKETIFGELKKNPYLEDGKPFSVKLSVVDGLVTAGIKWLEDEKYDTVLTYPLQSGSPTGYVHIWTYNSGNFAIDNLKIKNLDQEPNLIETEYKGSKWPKPEHHVYQPMERVYRDAETGGKSAISSWYLLIPAVAVVGGVALGVTALATRGRKKKKEAAEDEQ